MKLTNDPVTASRALLIALASLVLGCGESDPDIPDPASNTSSAGQQEPATPTSPPDDGTALNWMEDFQEIASESARLEFIREKLVDAADDLDLVIATALADPSARLRREAMAMVGQLPEEQASPILVSASHDNDPFVRSDAVLAIDQLPGDLRFDALEAALGSPHSDTRAEVITIVANERSKPAIEILLPFLDDQDQSVKETATRQLNALVDQDFGSAQEARSWWNSNRSRFDSRLRLLPK